MDWKYLLTSFEGRINRAKFWAGVGVLFAAGLLANLIDMMLGLQIAEGLGILGAIVGLVSIYLGIALYAKRWHDRDKSGWWTLIILIPLIGPIWLLVECGILEGTKGANRFGPDPLGSQNIFLAVLRVVRPHKPDNPLLGRAAALSGAAVSCLQDHHQFRKRSRADQLGRCVSNGAWRGHCVPHFAGG